MNIKDYITLAKAGYMPADIKDITDKHPEVSSDDLISMSKAGYKPSDVKELLTLPVSDTTADPAPEVAPAAGEVVDNEKEVDYKSLYESTKIELDKAHAENIHKDISGGLEVPSDTDIITKAFENFM